MADLWFEANIIHLGNSQGVVIPRAIILNLGNKRYKFIIKELGNDV